MSKYGAKHNMPGYDAFSTGLCYKDVWEMLRDDSEDRTKWRYKSRGVVLGKWHELKLQLYEQAVDCGYMNKRESSK
jgi:hypothetical protein